MACKYCGGSLRRRSGRLSFLWRLLGRRNEWAYSCPRLLPNEEGTWVQVGTWRWYRCSGCGRSQLR